MNPPNVLWITLDSVRADHTTLDEYGRDTTPRLNSLADDGLGFTTCFSHSKSTLPSTGAIMSGLLPSRNTVGVSGDVLPEEVTTVAERFADSGYTTACLSRNSYLSSETDLDRGFQRFQWLASSTIRSVGPRTLLKYLMNIRKHSAGLTANTAKHASPLLMNDVAKHWLHDFESQSTPFFFYLHYNEPHRPYYPPLSYMDKYADDLEVAPKAAAERAYEIHETLDEIIAEGGRLDQSDWDVLRAMYDAEIAYTDEMVGRLVDYIDSLDLGDTIIVVTADHGELFGEYGLLSHKYVLHDSVIRVPLILNGLNTDLSVEETDIIQHNDVMRTLLEVAGADTTGHSGRDLREVRPEYAISQRGPIEFDRYPRDAETCGFDPFFSGTLSAIRTEDFKLLSDENRSVLLDIPDEENAVGDDYPEETSRLEKKLSTVLDKEGAPIGKARKGDYSSAVKRQLTDLGYLE